MVASLCNLIEKTSYEGEGGMVLESLAYKALKHKNKPKSILLEFQKYYFLGIYHTRNLPRSTKPHSPRKYCSKLSPNSCKYY